MTSPALPEWATCRVLIWLYQHPRYKKRALELALDDMAPEAELAEYFYALVDDAETRLSGTRVGRSLVELRDAVTPHVPFTEVDWVKVRRFLRAV